MFCTVVQCAEEQKDKIRSRIKNCELVVNLISLLGVCFTVETYCLISFYTDTMNYGYLFTGTGELFSSLSWDLEGLLGLQTLRADNVH